MVKKAKKSVKNPDKSKSRDDKKADKSVEIMGVTIFGTRKSEVLKKLWLQRKEMLHVATVNPEFIMEARDNPRFKSSLARCLTIADGYGVVWALRLAQGKLVERVSGVELVDQIIQHASQHGEKVFLLGGASGVAEKAADAMRSKYPDLQIYSYEGAKTVRVEKDEEASMTLVKINGISPDYLLVAYGSPYQDLWIEENRPYLRVRVAMGVGGTLDEWAGTVAACPAWIDRLGMKWFWRVAHEPWRMKRVLRVFHFAALVLYHKLID